MAEFKRIKVRVVLDGICGKLSTSGLTLQSLEPQEIVSESAVVPAYED